MTASHCPRYEYGTVLPECRPMRSLGDNLYGNHSDNYFINYNYIVVIVTNFNNIFAYQKFSDDFGTQNVE